MKILFVCWANVGRSQMAAAFYNHLTGTHDADSAGTAVELHGETLGDRQKRRGGTTVIDVMKEEEDIDIASSEQTQITEEMLDNYDHVISMAQHEHTPEWLRNNPKYTFWEVEDPGGKNRSKTQEAKNQIKLLVRELIDQLH